MTSEKKQRPWARYDRQRAKPRVSIVLSQEERDAAECLAAERGLSISALIGQLIFIEATKKKMPKIKDGERQSGSRKGANPLKNVTEIVGTHEYKAGDEYILVGPDDVHHYAHYYRLRSLIPEGSHQRRGRWRITVEFWPEPLRAT